MILVATKRRGAHRHAFRSEPSAAHLIREIARIHEPIRVTTNAYLPIAINVVLLRIVAINVVAVAFTKVVAVASNTTRRVAALVLPIDPRKLSLIRLTRNTQVNSPSRTML